MTGAELIAAERQRQVVIENYDAEHDSGMADTLALAAACYALPNDRRKYREEGQHATVNVALWGVLWPWGHEAWKPGDRVRELVKAGALIAAAIDSIEADR